MKKETISFIMLIVIAFSAAILTDSIWTLLGIFALLAIIFGISKAIKYAKQDKEKAIIVRDIMTLIVSIVSVFVGTIWYLALTLGIVTLILSLKRIRESGAVIAKVSTSFSIVGIVNSVFIYITTIMIIIMNG